MATTPRYMDKFGLEYYHNLIKKGLIEYIVGTQTGATNAWTGVSTSPSLFAGKVIIYHLPFAGNGTAATLNLTLTNGSTTGAKAVQNETAGAVTTEYAAGSDIFMVYTGSVWKCSAVDTTYAPLASPEFTGTPTAPTAAEGTSTTQIATTEFTTAAVDAEATIRQSADSGLAAEIAAEKARVDSLVLGTTTNASGWNVETLTQNVTVSGGSASYNFTIPADATVLEVAVRSAASTSQPWITDNVNVYTNGTEAYVQADGLTVAEVVLKITYGKQETINLPELTDIRLGADGKTYSTAGEAVRGQISDVKEDLSDIGEKSLTSVNLFDGDFDESGYIVSGVDTPNDNLKRTSKYYPIVGESTGNFYSYVSVTSDVFAFVFYDANKTFLANKNANNAQIKTNTLPEGAAYFRVYTRTAWAGNVTLALSYVNSYIPYGTRFSLSDGIVAENNLTEELQDKINDVQFIKDASDDLFETKTINIFDGTFPNSGYFDADGIDASGSSWKRTNYISIDASKSTLYFLRTAQPYLLTYCFYDAGGVGIGRASVFRDTDTTTKTSIAIPSTAKTIRFYTSVSGYSGNLMVSYTEQDEYIPYGGRFVLQDGVVSESNLNDALKAKVNKGLELTGKTIAFMGDSIIGNFYDATGVCANLAEKTGATVINCAFGGSRMAYEYSRYGDATPTASGYIDGATDAEKNQVNQYRYWNCLCGASLADAVATGTWTLQDNAVANMSGGLAYFAERLAQIKAVDWSKVDFVMWEYGTNDFMTKVVLEGIDMFAYDFAFRHTIETILTAYPNIRIITATPIYRWYQSGGSFTDDSNTHTENDYTGTSHKLTDFVAMAQSVSKEYQIPCIDDYYTMGANRFTRLAFFNSTDGTHPNEQGRERIAEHLASQLVTLI